MERSDFGKGEDHVAVRRCLNIEDIMHFKTEWRIEKYHSKSLAEAMAIGEKPYEVIDFEGNLLLNEGIQAFEDLLAGLATPTKWDNTNARLGVGDSSVAESASQTGLQGANQVFKGMLTSYPSRSGQKVSWKSEFTETEGNFAWNEFTADNGATENKNLNRKVQASGTKSGGTWTLTLGITIS